MGYELGPFCYKNSESHFIVTEIDAGWSMIYLAKRDLGLFYIKGVLFVLLAADRWHWSVLVVGVMVLVCLTVLLFYLLHDFVKSKFYLFLFLKVLNM